MRASIQELVVRCFCVCCAVCVVSGLLLEVDGLVSESHTPSEVTSIVSYLRQADGRAALLDNKRWPERDTVAAITRLARVTGPF